VINFELKDAAEGGVVEARYGQTYEGDGENFRVAGNIGLPLGDNGFVNLTAEYGDVNDTNRSIARDDVTALVAAGNLDILDLSVNTLTTDIDSVQIWGQPNVNDDIKLFINTGYDISDSLSLYAWGNYAERQVEGGFFFRNPTDRGGVFSNDGGETLLVGDLTADGSADCPTVPFIDTNGDGVNDTPEPTAFAALNANPNCFSFLESLPGGFVPRFGGDNQDIAFVVGARGDFDFGTGLGYDVSFSYGENTTDFFINNTINASLGPDTPRDFEPGGYEQEDINFNLDLNYGLPISGWASDLNIAAGFEYREETFTINQGDDASFALGPLATPNAGFPTGQGFASSSNGFGGFVPASAGSFSQDNIAIYGDLEGDITDRLSLQAALRYEDFSSFGDTLNWKLGGKYSVSDNLTLRGTVSTGFHAPTAGQANVVNITTAFVGGVLQDVGFATTLGNVNLTVDYFNIDLEGRISLTDNQDFTAALTSFAEDNNVALVGDESTSQLINLLDGVGTFNAADFAGSEDLAAFAVFANNFDTRTQGIDVVASMPVDFGVG